MDQIAGIRRFNRFVARRIGALSGSYLARGRPLGEARVLFELGNDGLDLGVLKVRLDLDSGYLSRLLRSLERQGLVSVEADVTDRRRRRVIRTASGQAEAAHYDRLSDDLARSILQPLNAMQRSQLVDAMGEVEALMRAGGVQLDIVGPDGAEGRICRAAYFDELARRFEGGFDAALGKTSRDDDMRPPGGAFLVARLDGEPVGCGGFCRLGAEVAEVKRMWVAPDARGLGIAKRLLGELERLAGVAGYRAIRLDTNRSLGEAQAFYRKEGYREIARYNENPYADFWFEKRLTPEGSQRDRG